MVRRIWFCGLVCLFGCSDKKETTDEPVFNNANPTYRDARMATISATIDGGSTAISAFLEEAENLKDALQNWDGTPSDTVATAYQETMATWQFVEGYNFGPIADVTSPGGSGFRDEIYSWPTVNSCRIDQELVTKSYENAETFSALLINARGLDAIERLITHDGENACPPQTDINANGTWDQVTDLDTRKADYARAAINDVLSNATSLQSAYNTFANQEDQIPTADFPNEQEALNVLSGALFYIDVVVKDLKIGVPFGQIDCATDTCFEREELQTTELSSEAVHQNLLAFEAQVFGPNGYAALLDIVGASDVSQSIRADLDVALELSAENPSLTALYDGDTDKANELFTRVKAISDILKSDFVSMLDLELPQRAEGDND